MSLKTVVTVALLVFVVVAVGAVIFQSRETATGTDPLTTPAVQAEAGGRPDGVVAIYFHGNVRCVTCKKLEAYSRDAFEGSDIALEVINVDLPENRHYEKEFQLVTRSLVLVEYRSGSVERWSNLDRIWELVGDPKAYLDYVGQQTGEFERAT